jgi:hypothetical protein
MPILTLQNEIQFLNLKLVFESRGGGQEMFLLYRTPRLFLGPTQPPIKLVRGSSSAVKQPGSQTDHLSVSTAEVKNEWSCDPICLHGMNGYNFTCCVFAYKL